jgi:hypothetical protein
MPRLKNLINDKERKTQCVATEGSIVYKVPIGDEQEKLGHFIESEIVNKVLVFRFAIKQPSFPALRIEEKEEFKISFD